ncbi:WD40 repeat-like protein [Epithele typhae]|uniref:WD40 repeat-like protein n=1 Tax=Epithele typhae TaxID=378194 RepID=UPI002008DCD3|nr:WD40 repeat-like protein [Epithele typhae]KAH9932736.1 WD40 repeat-like protein [Epithele typhae]
MAKLDSCSLSLPATVSLANAGKGDVNLTEASLSASAASCIAFWGPPPGLSNPIESTDKHDARTAQRVAIGCTDGSVFILDVPAPTSPSVAPRTPHGDPLSPPLSPRRYLGLGHASSRSASPSSTIPALSPFHVTRSRIVSSVTTEQAEAPKNYVDFEDEQERLKGMLKGKEQRMRHASRSRTRPERNSFSTDRSLAATPSSSNGGGSSQKKEDARSYLSAALSPAPSTLSLSGPPSPTLFPAVSSESNSPPTATLRYHVFPPQSSTGRPVSSVKTHDGGRYFTCLLETGALSVHCTSDGRCVASITAEVKPPPSTVAGKVQTTPPMLWVWRSLLVAASDESIAIFACASPHEFYPAGQVMESVSDSERQAIVAVYELILPGEAQAGEASLEHLGQWPVNGQVDTIGLRAEPDHSLTLFHIGPAGHFSSRTVRVLGPLPDTPPDLPESSSTHLPLPNPFKVLKSLSTDHLAGTNKDQPLTRLELSNDVVTGEINSDFPIIGLRAHDNGDAVRWCAWSAQEMMVCDWSNDHLEQSASIPATKVRDVKWMDHDSFVALFSDRAEVWRVAASPGRTPSDIQCQMVQSAPFTPGDAVSLAPGGHIVSTHLKDKTRRIHYLPLEPSMSRPPQSRTLWAGHRSDGGAKLRSRISYMLPLELDLIIAGYSDGLIHRTSLIDLIQHTRQDKSTSDISLGGAVVHLDIVQNPRTNERVLVGGSDDGAIAIWDISTLAACARWTVFTTPLAQVISLHDEDVGRLHGCVLCVSQDGTVAVVAIDDYQFVYLVPGSAAPLARISLSEDNMLLVYADGRARLWDTRTREFWRSMSIEKGEELIQAGGWSQWSIGDRPETRCSLRALNHGASPDAASTLLLDISSVLRQLSATPALASSASNALSPKAKLENARAVLSMLLTFGVSEGVDSICTESLGIAPHPAPLGLSSSDAVSLFPSTARSDAWTVSPEASADRALVILSLLHYLTQYEDLAQDANTVMTFYTASVGQLVLESYQPPSLPRLGQHLLNTLSSEVRHTARLLFDAGVARLSDHETTEIMDNWQNYLPTLRSEKEKESQQSALALCVCGFIAVDKYTLLTPGTLTEIAKSIALYLHDEASPYRSLAIDLCSRGFQVWQQYVDAVEMLRALFTLATTTKKEAIAAQNVGAQARTAVLQIAASNSPLFMTTLAIDILHPRSPTARRAVLQLVVFLVRKQPLVLYAGLPRLLDAVVKALDPNASAAREAALDPATEILSHIVQTFPTVDFHGPTQRLAVGTSEGAVVMHDLKTATRLYVLEGHKRRTTACSFSPDGRRLVTVSLEEAAVLVWKVGSSFTSFFLPGAPPRQGHGGSEPFKRLSFNIGEAAHMSLEETLVNVRFEWAGDRSVKLMVKDSVMTFST